MTSWNRGVVAVLGVVLSAPAYAEFVKSAPIQFQTGRITALSGDGETALGPSGYGGVVAWRPFQDDEDAVEEIHGSSANRNLPEPKAASMEGSVFVGEGYRWSPFGIDELGPSSFPTDVSADGEVVVGWHREHFGQERAFVWREGDITLLPSPPELESTLCSAEAVSANGEIVAGICRGGSPASAHAVRWQNGVPALLGVVHEVRGISADGSTIVGSMPTEDGLEIEAFSWRDGVFTRLGSSARGGGSVAVAVSADGSTIVGASPRFPSYEERDAVVLWDEIHGMRSLHDLLSARGVVPFAWLQEATAISDDGSMIAGRGLLDSWIAYIAPDADNDRVPDGEDAFPDDPTESSDRDGDGVADGRDSFPDDPSEWADRDADGVGDHADPHPYDPTRPHRAVPAPGNVLVTAGAAGLFQVDPATGAVSWLAHAPGYAADDVVVGPSRSVYTMDFGRKTLHRVYSSTGEIRAIAVGLAGRLGFDREERPLILTREGAVRVDPATRRVTLLRTEPVPIAGTSPYGDGFGFDGSIVVPLELRKALEQRLSKGSAAPVARPITVTGMFSMVPEPQLVDLAAAGPGRFVSLQADYPDELWLALRDPLLGRSGEISPGWSTWTGFSPNSVAMSADGALYVAGYDVDHGANALFALDDPEEPGRPLLRGRTGLGARDAWRLAVVPTFPKHGAALECQRGLSAHVVRHAKARGKVAARCLDGHARGVASAETCLEGWPIASRALRKTRAAEARRCEPGAAGGEVVGAAARAAVDGLLADVFGDLDSAVAPRGAASGAPNAAACQLAVTKASARCLVTSLSAFQRCKKKRAADFDADDFESCAATAGVARVRRACDAASSRLIRAVLSRACRGVDLHATFPGCDAPGAAGVAACAGESAACRACRAMEAVHGSEGRCACSGESAGS